MIPKCFPISCVGKCIIEHTLLISDSSSFSGLLTKKLYPANNSSAPSPVITDFLLLSFAHFIAKYITTLLRISISLKFFNIFIVFSTASSISDVVELYIVNGMPVSFEIL